MDYFRTFFLLVFLPAVLFSGCKADAGEDSPHAYIAGEIVNPINDYVVLLRNNKVLDTLYLDQANRFKSELKNTDVGLYILKHGANSQKIYMEPGDSILVRANTMEFDASLHFSGEGAAKNNFLINTFLEDKANRALIFSYYDFPPEEFAKKTDSIKASRLETLEKRDEKYHFSDNFLEMAKKNILYEFYDLRERYTYMVNTYYEDFAGKIPKDFHDYRKRVNFNEEILQPSPSYIRFIEIYLINKSLADCRKKASENTNCTIFSSENVINRIELLDKLIQLPDLRRHLLSKLGAQAMTMAKNWEETRSILKVLRQKGLDEKGLGQLKRLALIQTAFMPGIIPRDVPFLNSSGEKVVVQDIVTKPTIFYIWSMHSKAKQEKEHKIIENYAIKYPEINFIGVNVDLGETEEWITTIKKYGYNPKKAFQLGDITIDDISIKKELYKYYLDKMVFINADGEIIIGHAYLQSPTFENKILEFLNQ